MTMMNVQRSALDEGGESLNVEPQAYGGRKILVHVKMERHIICANLNRCGYSSSIFNRVASIEKLSIYKPYNFIIIHSERKEVIIWY